MINYSWLSPTFRIHLGCVLSAGIHAIQVHKLKFVNEHLQFINPWKLGKTVEVLKKY